MLDCLDCLCVFFWFFFYICVKWKDFVDIISATEK